jgi:succinate dehydrogenase / fumarate reductase membrane anchor subunit
MNDSHSRSATVKNAVSPSATLHWLMQRITAILLIPLSLQFVVFLDLCLNSPYQDALVWLQKPLNFSGLSLWFLAVFYHAALGLQVVIEDYIGDADLQHFLIKLINGCFLLLALGAILLLFKIV